MKRFLKRMIITIAIAQRNQWRQEIEMAQKGIPTTNINFW